MKFYSSNLMRVTTLVSSVFAACLSGGNDQTINSALAAAGTNGVVQLCPYSSFTINNAVVFTANGQELSTAGYPTDASRAIIQISPSNTKLANAVSGYQRSNIKLRNIVVEGNRPSTWQNPSGNLGLVDVGGDTSGVMVSGMVIRNARSNGCLRVITGNTAYPYGCTKATISNNDIGPCGTNYQVSHGILNSCAKSVVTNNRIVGHTAAGIVLYGTPESTYTGNTITGGTTYRAYGGIKTDGGYNGNFSGVVVSNNQINGGKMINIGIAIGSGAWVGTPNSDSSYFFGPAQFTGNTFTGNIVTSIGASGWKNGLTVDGTNSNTVKPNSLFADAVYGEPNYDCIDDYANWKAFYLNIPLWYFSQKIQAPYKFGTNFKDITFGTPTNSLCMAPAIPNGVIFTPGQLTASAGQRISYLHGGIALMYQSDNSLVVLNYSNPDSTTVMYDSRARTGGRSCGTASSNQCRLVFDTNGQLVNTYGGSVVFSSPKFSPSCQFAVVSVSPWFYVFSTTPNVIVWTSKEIGS